MKVWEPENTCYKENLLQNCRYVMGKHGGKLIVRGERNDRKVSFIGKDGKTCVVWFPFEPRVRDIEIDDMKDALYWITGEFPFQGV